MRRCKRQRLHVAINRQVSGVGGITDIRDESAAARWRDGVVRSSIRKYGHIPTVGPAMEHIRRRDGADIVLADIIVKIGNVVLARDNIAVEMGAGDVFLLVITEV